MAAHLVNHGKGVIGDIPIATVIGHNHEVVTLSEVLGLDSNISHGKILHTIGSSWSRRKGKPILGPIND